MAVLPNTCCLHSMTAQSLRQVLTAVFKSARFVEDFIRDHAGAEIFQDRDLMMLACDKNCEVFRLLGPHLQQDEVLLRAMIEGSEREDAFSVIPIQVQSMYPDLTVQALYSLSAQNVGFFLIVLHQIFRHG
jgi:hypothetical protein